MRSDFSVNTHSVFSHAGRFGGAALLEYEAAPFGQKRVHGGQSQALPRYNRAYPCV